MRITRFAGRRIHGHLNLDIPFDESLTFLTGINGSGKTTVVQSTVALLTPSLRTLVGMAFDSLRVEFMQEDEKGFVAAERGEDELKLACSDTAETLVIPVFHPDPHDNAFRAAEHEAEFYRDQEVVHSRHQVLGFIRSLPTPMFLDLARRTGSVRRRRPVPSSSLRYARNVFSGTLEESLQEAEELAAESYAQFQSYLRELTEALRKDLILTAFHLQPESGSGWEVPGRHYVQTLARNQQLVLEALGALGVNETEIGSHVVPFFDRLRHIVQHLPKGFGPTTVDKLGPQELKAITSWFAMQSRELQIRRVVELVETYTRATGEGGAPVGLYLKSINDFFADAGKQVRFLRTGRLAVELAGVDVPKPLTALSSGERQLVVILTHLAFNRQARAANVLIIDEPELSLHLKWQEMFVDSVLTARPGIQLILATHSPSIILDRTDHCAVLGLA